MDTELKKEIIMDNYLNPYNKELPENIEDYIKINSNNVSCIDNIDLYILIKDYVIKDIKFVGEACAISTSSTSIMIQELIGKSTKEALDIINNFQNMIEEKEYNSNKLNNANVYDEIYKQQNRKRCALLPWDGIKKVLMSNKTIEK